MLRHLAAFRAHLREILIILLYFNVRSGDQNLTTYDPRRTLLDPTTHHARYRRRSREVTEQHFLHSLSSREGTQEKVDYLHSQGYQSALSQS